MINLRLAVNYIDPQIINVFDRYKWGLSRLGVDFDQEVLDAIEFSGGHLEDSLIAFCSWTLQKREDGVVIEQEILSQTLVSAIRNKWIPSAYQENFLRKYDGIFKSARWTIWEKAAEILGHDKRNQTISDVTETGELVFFDYLDLASFARDRDLLTLRSYIRNKGYLSL